MSDVSRLAPLADQFVGRTAEIAAIVDCARRAAAGEPWTVLVFGEPGIGKSALVRRCLERPELAGFTVLRAACDPIEADAPYGIVEQLTARLDPESTDSTPLTAGMPPFRVGSGLLGQLNQIQAAKTPVAVIIDDIQWADSLSVKAVGFVLRRLWTDNVIVLLTARSPTSTDAEKATVDEWRRMITGRDHALQLPLSGLTVEEVSEALRTLRGKPMHRLADRLWEHTHGHPLYLRTILTETSILEPQSGLTVPASLADSVGRQLAGLSPEGRALVELMAVLDERCPLGRIADVAQVADPRTVVEPLLAAGLVVAWPDEPATPVRIRHPLQRDAIYQAIPQARRAALHQAVVPLTHGDRRWRHRVAATDGTDEQLADELANEAELLLADAHSSRAASLLTWSADLTADQAKREQRRLIAAVRLLWTEQFVRAQPLIEDIEQCAPSPLRSLALARYAMTKGNNVAVRQLLTEAMEGARDQPDLVWAAGMAALWLATFYLFVGDGPHAVEAARAGLDIEGLPPLVTGELEAELIGCHSYVSGPDGALRELAAMTDLPSARSAVAREKAALYFHRAVLRTLAGHPNAGLRDFAIVRRLADAGSQPTHADFGYPFAALAHYLTGHWDDATIDASHAIDAGLTDDLPYIMATAYAFASFVPAGRGNWDLAGEYAGLAEHWANVVGVEQYMGFSYLARAAIAQARGDHAAMLVPLDTLLESSACDGFRRSYQALWRPMHVEALLGTGALPAAGRALAELRDFAADSNSLTMCVAWLSGWHAQLSGDLRGALDVFQNGLVGTSRTEQLPLHQARLQQSYGTALAKLGKTVEAVTQLRDARAGFDQLGARPFGQRCAADLAAADSHAIVEPSAGFLGGLTEREHQIAVLIGRGKTNPEIASELFLSTKTIEYHVSHIFAKIGVTNRRQLRDRVNETRAHHSV